jgi:hypothetical protein
MKWFRIILIITFVISILNNTIPIAFVFFNAVSLSLMILITYKYPLLKHLSKYVALFVFWISLSFMPSFHLVMNIAGEYDYGGYIIRDLDYQRILSFGSVILMITCLSWMSFSYIGKNKTSKTYIYYPHLITRKQVIAIFVVMFGLSIFSMAIGLSRMGGVEVVLPFHLAGIITLTRIVFFPILFSIIVENQILCKKGIPKDYFIWFFIWALLEVFVRYSKSSLIGAFMPVTLMLYFYFKPNLLTLLKRIAPIIVLFLFLYPIVETMRTVEEGSLTQTIKSSAEIVNSENSLSNPILRPLNRTFMTPHMYAKDFNWISTNSLFDFSNTGRVMAWGGAADFQTFIIDGYPLGIPHSSGTTGLQDPLLHGGYGLCFIMVALIMLCASFIDSMTDKKMISIYVALIILLLGFCNTQNITAFYDAVGLQYEFARVFAIFIAYYLNFRRRKIITISKI